jgi:hypothetical protein
MTTILAFGSSIQTSEVVAIFVFPSKEHRGQYGDAHADQLPDVRITRGHRTSWATGFCDF